MSSFNIAAYLGQEQMSVFKIVAYMGTQYQTMYILARDEKHARSAAFSQGYARTLNSVEDIGTNSTPPDFVAA